MNEICPKCGGTKVIDYGNGSRTYHACACDIQRQNKELTEFKIETMS